MPDDRYAIVEVFGHTRHVGRISEVSEFGVVFCRIELIDKQGNLGRDVRVAGASIFRLSKVSREEAIVAVRPWDEPGVRLLPSESDEAIEWDDPTESDVEPHEKCETEGCLGLVTHHDAEGVPLCDEHWQSLADEAACRAVDMDSWADIASFLEDAGREATEAIVSLWTDEQRSLAVEWARARIKWAALQHGPEPEAPPHVAELPVYMPF